MSSATRVGCPLSCSSWQNSGSRRRILAAAAACGLFVAGSDCTRADDGDPPQRVALLNLLEGAGAIQPAGSTQWQGDVVNRPLGSGDKVWVDVQSRAELHLGSTAIRLGANTGLQFLNIADAAAQLRLTAGSIDVRLRYLSPDERFEIDTPNSAVALLRAGEYRIDVDESGGAVAVAVFSGQAQVSGRTQSFTLDPEQRGEFHGGEVLGVEFTDLQPADAFDLWSGLRNQREDAALSANYVSREVPGYESLDQYGTWDQEPDVGAVWVPRVAVDWAPYSAGRWLWLPPWGWTWVDDSPWGFAPSHYGRWVRGHAGWCWAPGGFALRPVYAPALVAWIDAPAGGVAWVALGYNEIYRPPYRASDRYLREINVSNTYIGPTAAVGADRGGRRYVNQTVTGAVSAVSRENFVAAKPVKQGRMLLDPRIIAVATATTAKPAVAPTAESYGRALPGSHGPVAAPNPALFRRVTVAQTAPPVLPGNPAEQRRSVVTQAVAAPRAVRSDRPTAMPLQERESPPRRAETLRAAEPPRSIESVRPIEAQHAADAPPHGVEPVHAREPARPPVPSPAEPVKPKETKPGKPELH